MKASTFLAKLFIAAVACAILLLALARGGLINLPRRFDPLALPDLAAPPDWLTAIQMKTVDASLENCLLALSRTGLALKPEPARSDSATCRKDETVMLQRLSRAAMRPEETRCAMAARLYYWERHVLQPAALATLGAPITEIIHFGSYSCRPIRGSSSMSEHATANAFDIAGFRLANGKRVSVLKDWQGTGPEARFLRLAHAGLCDWFNLTLSPDYNPDHADHFHVDMGLWRSCR